MDALNSPRRFRRKDGSYPPLAGADPSTDEPRSIEQIEQRQADIRRRLEEINTEHEGRALPQSARDEWNALRGELDQLEQLAGELRTRRDDLARIAGETPQSRESGFSGFQTARPGAIRGNDVWDLTLYRSQANDIDAEVRLLRDGAKRALEMTGPSHENASRSDAERHLEHILTRAQDKYGEIPRRILQTGSPIYQRAFTKLLAGAPRTAEEERALSTSGSGGGYAVPFQVDPTIIPTSNGVVNPLRRISRKVQMAGTTWKGVSSDGVSASFGAEGTEVGSDGAPSLAQPSIDSEKAHTWIPYSIEIGQDWRGIEGELAELIQDAKDVCEATAFLTGSGSDEPYGLLTGATTNVSSAGSAAFAVADVYAVEEALGARFRPMAQWVANRYVYNKARQFDTAGGASLFVDNLRLGLANDPQQDAVGGNTRYELIQYPANELSTMAASIASNAKAAVLGDFRYYVIADRIGLDVEVVQHVMGANQRPTGQRGLYAYWRVGAKVISAAAFRVLIIK